MDTCQYCGKETNSSSLRDVLNHMDECEEMNKFLNDKEYRANFFKEKYKDLEN